MNSNHVIQKTDIQHLAAFLNIKVCPIDDMDTAQQATLLLQLTAIARMKLARLSLQIGTLSITEPCLAGPYPGSFPEHTPPVG
jgi:hypothetical protein